MVKNPLSNAGDAGGLSSISVLGRSPEEDGNILHYSCLENPMDRIVWRATVYRVAKSRTQLKQLSMHAHAYMASKILPLIHYRMCGTAG